MAKYGMGDNWEASGRRPAVAAERAVEALLRGRFYPPNIRVFSNQNTHLSKWKKGPNSCLGDLLGMKSYPVIFWD